MTEKQARKIEQYREIAILTIVPGIVGILIILSWALSHWKIGPYYLNSGLAFIAVMFGGYQRFIAGFKDIYHRKITVNVFVVTALIATVLAGEFIPAAIIVFIMAVSGALECYTLDKSRKSIRNLLDLSPKAATVKHGQEEINVNVSDLKIGDVIIIRPGGEHIPVDGVVIAGASSVNQAPITDESMPVEKIKGNSVFSGTLNQTGRLEVETARVGPDTMPEANNNVKLPFFERYLSFWVILCIIAGIIIGKIFPAGVNFLSRLEVSQVNIPVAVLIWLMIYPMMAQIDFSSIVRAGKKPKGLVITLVVNWLIKPFTMAVFAAIFFKYIFAAFISPALAKEYIAGAILLGAAPCTAMVFVWSYLTKGDPAYTLVQVAVNDLVILVAFVPIVKFLLGVNQIIVPYDTLIYSTIFFVVIPLTGGYISRVYLLKAKGADWFENIFLKALKPVTVVGLLLTLVILFAFQGNIILGNPLHILLIAVPLTIQTYFIFFIGYFWSKKWRLAHNIASPAAMIGASNFFELSVAVAISLFGLKSGAALATVVGVLTEVPIMLSLVYFSNRTRHWFGPEKRLLKG